MCTVLLRFAPGSAWPLVLAAVRDEFMDRAWDPPGAYWPDRAPGVVAGRDRVGGGTWLAVRGRSPAVAALLNGVRRPPPIEGTRPTRGRLALAALTGTAALTAEDLADYDGFHLILADATQTTVWTWDGATIVRTDLTPGDHIIVNEGVDTDADPLVPHFRPLLAATASPVPSGDFWPPWQELLRGDGLPGDDPRALIMRQEFNGRTYGSSSASLVGIPADGEARFAFTATPATPQWRQIPVAHA